MLKQSLVLVFILSLLCLPGCNPKPKTGKTVEVKEYSAEAEAALDDFIKFTGYRSEDDDVDDHLALVLKKASENRIAYPEVSGDEWDYYVALAYNRCNRKEDFRAKASDFIARYPDSQHIAQMLMLKGYSHYLDKQFAASAECYRAVIENHPDYPAIPLAMQNCAVNYFYAKNNASAMEICQALIEDYPNGAEALEAHSLIGLIFHENGEYEIAAQHFWEYLVNSMKYIYTNRSRTKALIEALQLIRVQADSPEEILKADAMLALYYFRAYDPVKRARNTKACDSAFVSLQENLDKLGKAPFAAAPAYVYAFLLQHLRPKADVDAVIAHWEKIAPPGIAVKFFALRLTRLRREPDGFEMILQLVEKAPAEYLNNVSVLQTAANAAMYSHNYEAAVHYAELALKLSPKDRDFEKIFNSCSLIGKAAPEISGKNIVSGEPIKLSSLKGKVVLIDFWATWCGPCVREVPNVVAVYEKYKAKGFEVFGVSLDKDGMESSILKFCNEHNMPWPQIYEGLGWDVTPRKDYKFNGIPFMVLLDTKGIIRYINKRGDSLEPAVKELLGIK